LYRRAYKKLYGKFNCRRWEVETAENRRWEIEKVRWWGREKKMEVGPVVVR
jgi:hypothetical protein